MRNIEFRGKNEYDKWVYGTGIIQYDTGEIGILSNFSKYGKEATEMYHRTNVLPETVGQYTGLKDKNGKKIFGGDIIIMDSGNLYSVVYSSERVAYVVKSLSSFGNVFSNDLLSDLKLGRMKIIGNIHDNKELR